jgi:hypothetical protein
MIADAPKTREALVVVEAARSNLTEAWGNALSSNTTRQPLPMDLAGPVIQGETVLEKAFERLTEAATGSSWPSRPLCLWSIGCGGGSGVADVSPASGAMNALMK